MIAREAVDLRAGRKAGRAICFTLLTVVAKRQTDWAADDVAIRIAVDRRDFGKFGGMLLTSQAVGAER